MKTILKTTMKIAAFAAIAIGIASAQVSHGVEIKIPFDFTVKNQVLPAGTYTISTDYTFTVWVRGVENHQTMVLTSNDIAYRGEAGTSRLVFRFHDGKYYLASMWDGLSTGRDFPPSRAERDVENVSRETSLVTLVSHK